MLWVATELEKQQRDALTFSAWGDGLSLPDYLERQARLRGTAYGRRSMHTWLWKNAKGDVLASCETYRMLSTFKGKPAHVYGIASLFTEEKCRRQGHAADLMKALLVHLPQRDKQAVAAILYSEMGEHYFGAFGFSKRISEDWVWPVSRESPSSQPLAIQRLKEEALQLALPRQLTGQLQVLPTLEQIDWQLQRERLYAIQFGKTRPEFHGALASQGRALWRAQYRTQELGFLTFEADTVETAWSLLACAQEVARKAGLKAVRWWKTPLPFEWQPAAETKIEARENRDLPMICPLQPQLVAEDWVTLHRAVWV